MIEINSLDTLYALIAKNTGVGFIPATLVRPEDLGRKIVCYRLKDLQARQTFVIARDPERELTAAAAEFIGDVRTSFSYVLLRLREDKGFNASAPCMVAPMMGTVTRPFPSKYPTRPLPIKQRT